MSNESITHDTLPSSLARHLDELGAEYLPADLATRRFAAPADQPPEIQLTNGADITSGPVIYRDDELLTGWCYYWPGSCEPHRYLADYEALTRLARHYRAGHRPAA